MVRNPNSGPVAWLGNLGLSLGGWLVLAFLLLPILFIALGLGETSKIALITIGITPYLVRDLAMRVEELPREQMIKAQTLGASTWQMMVRVVLPQILPRLMDGLRLSLGPAFLFLIAAEASCGNC